MLLPFLILAVRLLFFTLSLGAAAILGSVAVFIPNFTTEDFYDFAVFQWKHQQEEIPPEVKIPPEWKGLRELADVVWFSHYWGEDSPIKKALNQVKKQYPQYQTSIVQPNLYKGFIALVKQHKIQPPEQWNKQTPKEIKVNWTEAEVRDEWISLKTQ